MCQLEKRKNRDKVQNGRKKTQRERSNRCKCGTSENRCFMRIIKVTRGQEMQYSSSLSISLYLSLSLSWPLHLAFSFRIVISRRSEPHGSAEQVQRWEQFANSLSETRTRQACQTVRGRAGEPVRFGSLPPFRRSHFIALPTKHASWFLYFYIKRSFHRVRCDTHRHRSFLSTSGSSTPSSYPRFSSLSPVLRPTRNCEVWPT